MRIAVIFGVMLLHSPKATPYHSSRFFGAYYWNVILNSCHPMFLQLGLNQDSLVAMVAVLPDFFLKADIRNLLADIFKFSPSNENFIICIIFVGALPKADYLGI